MGGFKKSSKPESQQSSGQPSNKLFGVMSKRRETQYNQALEEQYQRAFDFTRSSRGRGLGYDPNVDPDNKTFFIDKQPKSTKL